jgi:hypothetical protein
VSYSVAEGRNSTSLSIHRSKIGFYLNPHGGKASDYYMFEFPKGLTHVRAADVTAYYLNYHDELAHLSEGSQIDLNINSEGCEILVSVFSKDGKALPINGRHLERQCGQNVRL